VRLSDFEGTWHLSRRIEDRRAGQTGHLDGRARFTAAEDDWHYSETGTLRLPGQAEMQAERRYLWRGAGAFIEVLFNDGRPFHVFDPAKPRPSAQHWCDPDSYRVRYDFTNWPDWSAEWHVTGPKKDYSMHSLYWRAASE